MQGDRVAEGIGVGGVGVDEGGEGSGGGGGVEVVERDRADVVDTGGVFLRRADEEVAPVEREGLTEGVARDG